MALPEATRDWGWEFAPTEEQKFVYDLRGWLLIPNVLDAAEISLLREHVVALKEGCDPDTSYPSGRWEMPSQALLDHPVVAGVLREIINPDRGEDCYGFRCESTVPRLRDTSYEGLEPHGGPGIGPLAYSCRNTQIYSGQTRVVWELNPIARGDGGTLLMSGSHKSSFDVHPDHMSMDSPLFDTYSCPAGSVLFFTESLCHAGPPWTNRDRPRISIFTAYSPDLAQYHKTNLDPAVIAAMPPRRRTLFRGVWARDFHHRLNNTYVDETNTAH